MRISELFLTFAALVVIIAGLKAAAVILVPFILSAFIAIVCAPSLFWLQRRGVPVALAVAIVMIVILTVLFLVTALAGHSLSAFVQDLPRFKEAIGEQFGALLSWLSIAGLHTDTDALVKILRPSAALNLTADLLNGLGNLVTNMFLILLTVIFMLLEAAVFAAKIKAVMVSPDTHVPRWQKFLRDVNRYMVLKTRISLLTGLLVSGWMALIGVDYPLLWGILAFMLNYIPNIGSIIASIPAILQALIQLGAPFAVAVAFGFLAINMVLGNILEPRIMGRGLGLSALVVFLSLLFWGWVLGPIGMLLSVPLTITAKIALESRPETRWAAIMLGPGKDVKVKIPEPGFRSKSEPEEQRGA